METLTTAKMLPSPLEGDFGLIKRENNQENEPNGCVAGHIRGHFIVETLVAFLHPPERIMFYP